MKEMAFIAAVPIHRFSSASSTFFHDKFQAEFAGFLSLSEVKLSPERALADLADLASSTSTCAT